MSAREFPVGRGGTAHEAGEGQKPAGGDLVDIGKYIAARNLDAAMRFLRAAEEDFAKLAAMPGMGPACDFAIPNLAGLRSYPITGFRNYLTYYLPGRGGITVIRVLHGARDVGPLLGN